MFRLRTPTARSKNFLVRIARFLWTLPTNLLGHALGLLWARARPSSIGGAAASASLYRLPTSRVSRALGALAVGDVVLAESRFIGGARGRWVLAHELSHTLQHGWLGPLYLPAHILLQLASALLFLVRPLPNFTPQHAYNPLERWLLHVPFDVLVGPSPTGEAESQRIWQAFGLLPARDSTNSGHGVPRPP